MAIFWSYQNHVLASYSISCLFQNIFFQIIFNIIPEASILKVALIRSVTVVRSKNTVTEVLVINVINYQDGMVISLGAFLDPMSKIVYQRIPLLWKTSSYVVAV